MLPETLDLNLPPALSRWSGWLFCSVLLLGLSASVLFFPEALGLILALAGMLAITVCLGSSYSCLVLAMLTLFTGILTALPIGFTLKGPQLFALIGLLAWGLERLRHSPAARTYLKWQWSWPFLAFVLCLLPSFFALDRTALGLSQDDSSLRLLFNYGLLQLFTLFLLLRINQVRQLLHLSALACLSCGLSLLFGFGQQVAFYAGRYDPLAFVGRHSSIIDFYGPFLRLSPGTFANEYGEILQSVGILVIGLLFLIPNLRKSSVRLPLFALLLAVLLGLILNFTRASWLVFAVGAFGLLLFSKLRWRALLSLFVLGSIALGLLFWLSQILLEASVLFTIGRRFQELGQVQSHSAGQRLETWAMAWDAFLESPWIGHGWGQFGQTHNVPLQLLAETGVLGAIGFYGLMAWCSYQMLTAWRLAQTGLLKGLQLTYLMAFWGCLAFDLTNHGIYHFVLWFCLGMGLACAQLIWVDSNQEPSNEGFSDQWVLDPIQIKAVE